MESYRWNAIKFDFTYQSLKIDIIDNCFSKYDKSVATLTTTLTAATFSKFRRTSHRLRLLEITRYAIQEVRSSKLRGLGYLHRRGLVCASSSCREWRSHATTNPDRAACAAVVHAAPTHSTWPAPRGPMRATKQNRVSKCRASAGTKRSVTRVRVKLIHVI